MTIRSKLLTGFIVVAALVALAGGIGIFAFSQIVRNISRMEETIPWLFSSFRMKERLAQSFQVVTRYLAERDPSRLAALEEDFSFLMNTVEMYEEALLSGTDSPAFKEKGQFRTAWEKEGLQLPISRITEGSETSERVRELSQLRENYRALTAQLINTHRERLIGNEELARKSLALDDPVASLERFMLSLETAIAQNNVSIGQTRDLLAQYALTRNRIGNQLGPVDGSLNMLESGIEGNIVFSRATKDLLIERMASIREHRERLVEVIVRSEELPGSDFEAEILQTFRDTVSEINRLGRELSKLSLNEWITQIGAMNIARKNYIIAPDDEKETFRQAHDSIFSALGEFLGGEFLKSYEERMANHIYEKNWQEYALLWSDVVETSDRLEALENEQNQALERMHSLQADFSHSLDEFNRVISGEFRSAVGSIHATEQSLQRVLYGTTAAGLVIAVVLGLLLASSIVRPLRKGMEFAGTLASGDLTGRVENRKKDETGHLLESLNTASTSLRSFMSEVATSARFIQEKVTDLATFGNEVAQTGEQIAQTVSQVSQGSEDQSRNLSEVSEKMGELVEAVRRVSGQLVEQVECFGEAFSQVETISRSINETARNLDEARTRTQESAESTRQGQERLTAVSSAMHGIQKSVVHVSQIIGRLGESSREIGNITDLITGIADETNLLALNAAIEAARAGEAGRGFAVVAQEVRKLAEESAQAAQRISGLIGDIQKEARLAVGSMEESTGRVSQGVGAVAEAGRSFETITQLGQRVNEEVSQIARSFKTIEKASQQVVDTLQGMVGISRSSHDSANEAASLSEDISVTLASVASISEENAALSEEVAAGSEEQNAALQEIRRNIEEINRMAKRLEDSLGKFKI
ncbi:MAG TPA: methyl-accepting chemotaxis protein [Atribacteraceae bacterium]|nr:methyl-accepting chemotaxis protein [Atribacteraceae bacterium]